ncbi:chromosome partition protein Smc-like [Clytia hemisphaerica]|uniref:Uncharacterized protein n=1 Tax=Clytia hemisphaerica TaxID=252671 RepID=A0A7M6DQN2_9CNID
MSDFQREKVVIRNAQDDLREHNAHGVRRRIDEHNAAGLGDILKEVKNHDDVIHDNDKHNNHQGVVDDQVKANVVAHVQKGVKNHGDVIHEDDNHQAISVNDHETRRGEATAGNTQNEVKAMRKELQKLKMERELEKLKMERELEKDNLKREKEIEAFEGVVEKIKIENEQLKKDFEMQKLKAEVVLLKTEKQFALDAKILSEQKHKVEEEMKVMKIEKELLLQEKKDFKEKAEKLQNEKAAIEGKYETLQNVATEKQGRFQMILSKVQNELKKSTGEVERLSEERNQFEKLYETTKSEKDRILQEKKMLEGKLNELQEKSPKKPTKNIQHVNENRRLDIDVINDPSKSIQDAIKTLSVMIFEPKISDRYRRLYEFLYDEVSDSLEWQNFIVIRLWMGDIKKVDIKEYVNKWNTDKLKFVKVLHTKDNTKSRDMRHIAGSVWGSDMGWVTEYKGPFGSSCLIFVIK